MAGPDYLVVRHDYFYTSTRNGHFMFNGLFIARLRRQSMQINLLKGNAHSPAMPASTAGCPSSLAQSTKDLHRL